MNKALDSRTKPVKASAVVGASHGLGAAIAGRFAAAGHPVVVAGRNAAKLAETEAELNTGGPASPPRWATRPARMMDVSSRKQLAICAFRQRPEMTAGRSN